MAYTNRIGPGNPPMIWSDFKSALEQITENFTIIGTTLVRTVPKSIAHVESATVDSNPVRVVTTTAHNFNTTQRVAIYGTGISQLDGNTYFVQVIDDFAVNLYDDGSLSQPIDGTAFDAYSSGGGTIQGILEGDTIDFENFYSNFKPAESVSGALTLGDENQRWYQLHIEEYSEESNPAAGIFVGGAQIKGTGGVLDLPAGTTINGDLIIDPTQTFFKEVQVDNDQVVVASDFVDSLNLLSGTAIQMTVDSSAESITITNTGVTQLNAGSGIGVSSTTGNITLTNSGVRSLQSTTSLPSGRTEGLGININGSTGDNIKITNTGVLQVDAGFGITVSTDNATGIATVSFSAGVAPSTAFTRFHIVGDSTVNDLVSDSIADTFNLEPGYGISLSNNAGTDTITFSFDQESDIVGGSVFGLDSTLLVDGTNSTIPAGNLTGTATIDIVGNTTGYHTGEVKGSVFGDDSSKIIDAVENKVFADEIITPQIIATTSFGLSTGGLTSISTNDNIELNATSGAIYANTTLFDITGPLTVSGTITGNVTGNLTGYYTGDMTGSVFADDSTMLIDSTNGKIVGPIESESIRGNLIGSVFGDDSTMLVNAVDGSLAYYPTTASDWNGTAPTTVGEALDRIAAWIKASDGTGA